ncbi:molecular chaperone [Colwellia sp. M166]|uniref:molecular chaperone n=1 Tax=Colwellia sp. M166 TaxID=2583805 RepID=UPI00211E8951|nr:molecular chaperone [Colwellia sp. M166]UUO21769.1 molecular chaperone [Colwellia sp. M166]UUO25510.1 molecular chaperone [Colwellia sp. M166]|tara:strand:+ start:12901 stop:14259 length:1359 start_codon:yes stop_codon:yes gene_type:complete
MIGFDYGTSNCAVGVMENNKPKLLSLGDHGRYISSTLYAPSRDVIVNWLHKNLTLAEQKNFQQQRQRQLQKGQNTLRELTLDGYPTELSFGQQALNNYLQEPDEGYYIKSPKSFLGASGLLPQQVELFEDIVAAMMSNVKTLTEATLGRSVEQTVIGRPINFQGLRGEESNQQALKILTNAAKRVGFKDVEFQFEPVAAGFEYEASLRKETKVLVVDIGGGTSDCSMLLMGPKQAILSDRSKDLLSHSGERVGGNDFDIAFALKGIMPSFGLDSLLKTGKPMPSNSYWQAMAINNINHQTEFYSAANGRFLAQLIRDAEQPELLTRLLTVQQQKLSYRVVNAAEQSKIAITEQTQQQVDLSDIDAELSVMLDRDGFAKACQRELNSIASLMTDAITQANCQPDVVFVTGGTAKSPVLNQFLQQQFNHVPIVIGDHFGSVTAGLTRWANTIYT